MTKTYVKLKDDDRCGYVIEGDEICKENEVPRYFVESGTRRKLWDNFDSWGIKNGVLDRHARPQKRKPLVVKVGNCIFMG